MEFPEGTTLYKIQNEFSESVAPDGTKYGDMSAGEFAYRLWEAEKEEASSLAETLPMGQFADKFGIENKDFKEMLSYSKGVGYEPTGKTFEEGFVPELAEMRQLYNGWTFGWGDEITGALAAVTDYTLDNKSNKSIGELYEQYRDNEREQIAQYRKEHPLKSTGLDIAGSLLQPLTWYTRGAAPTTQSGVYGAAFARGATAGAAFGAGESEESTLIGIGKDAGVTGVTSGLFGVGLQKAFSGLQPSLIKKFDRANKDPEIKNLQIVKNAAYDAANKSKIRFDSKDFNELLTSVKKIAIEGKQSILKDAETKKIINMIKVLKSQNKPQTFGQMDELKKLINARYSANLDQPMLGQMAKAVDDVISKKATLLNKGDNPIAVARLANSRFMKAKTLDDEFYRAKLSLGAKGGAEGMGTISTYKNAVASILKDNKKRNYFNDDEIAMMEKFVDSNMPTRMVQEFADASPTMRKFLTMMAFAGSYMQPLFIIPTIGGAVAKKVADKKVKKGALELLDNLGNIARQETVKAVPAPGVVAPVAAQVTTD